MPSAVSSSSTNTTSVNNTFNPLTVNLKFLNPENEMRRKFGQKVVGASDNR